VDCEDAGSGLEAAMLAREVPERARPEGGQNAQNVDEGPDSQRQNCSREIDDVQCTELLTWMRRI
jgi:hypothetical protein